MLWPRMRGGMPTFFRRVPASDDDAKAVLAPPAEVPSDDAPRRWSPAAWWDWLTHPGRLWVVLLLVVIGFVVAQAVDVG